MKLVLELCPTEGTGVCSSDTNSKLLYFITINQLTDEDRHGWVKIANCLEDLIGHL